MEKLISTVFSFLILALIAGLFFAQLRVEFGIHELFPDRMAAPLILLAFGLPIAAFGYWLVSRFMRHVSPDRAAFPRYFITEFDEPELDRMWQRISMLIVCVVPLLFFAWAWMWFLNHGAAWLNDGTSAPPRVDRWEMVPFNLVYCDALHTFGLGPECKGWDAYRFGDLAAVENGKGGVSFLPFWHPVLWLIPMTAVVVLQSVRLIDLYRRRRKGLP